MGRGYRGIGVGVALCAALVGACSLLVDTDGLAGGDGPGADASSDARADVPSSVDGSSPDGAANAPFCAGHADAALCLDFDDGKALASYFSKTGFDPRVTSALDTSVASSAPASVSFAFPGGTLPNGALAHYANRVVLTPVATAVRMSYRLFIDSVSKTDRVRASTLVLDKNGGSTYIYVVTSEASTALQIQVYGSSRTIVSDVLTDLVKPIPVGVWTTVEIVVDASKSPAQVTPYLDGQPASLPVSMDAQLATGAAPAAALELTMYGPKGMTLAATRFHFDDVLLELR